MYTITDPGTLPGYSPEALDVNKFGAVVGVLRAVAPGRPDGAFVWRKFAAGLHVLPGLRGNAEARAINSTSTIAGAVSGPNTPLRAAYWDARQQLHVLPVPGQATESFAHDVSDADLVGGEEVILHLPRRA
jgi:hypothetical protein